MSVGSVGKKQQFEAQSVENGKSCLVRTHHNSLEELSSQIEKSFDVPFFVTYIDDEDDSILIGSDEELETALSFLPKKENPKQQRRPGVPIEMRVKKQQQSLEALVMRESNLDKRVDDIESKILLLKERKEKMEEERRQVRSTMSDLKEKLATGLEEEEEGQQKEVVADERLMATKRQANMLRKRKQNLQKKMDIWEGRERHPQRHQKVSSLRNCLEQVEKQIAAVMDQQSRQEWVDDTK
jgi:chromosome segregation ATPase